MTRAKDISKIVTDANLSGTLDVTGTVTAGGLSVNGDGSLNGTAVNLIFNETDTTDLNTRFRQSGALFSISTVNDSGSSPKAHLVVNNSTGDISFYEDTGTTPKLFWDASAERLGIGTASPASAKLHIENDLAGTQERCIYANQGQTSGTSAYNVAMFSASNSAFNGDLVRIHHENPNSNQVMFKTTTTGSNTTGFSIDEAGLTNIFDHTASSFNQALGVSSKCTSRAGLQVTANNASFGNTSYGLVRLETVRANSNAFNYAIYRAGDGADTGFSFRGDGNAFADNNWNAGGADYAEYFEWKDGNTDDEDRRGFTVVLDGNKIRKSTSDDDASSIIGVVSAIPAVVGDSGQLGWQGKHERDEWGSYILEEYTQTEWTDADGELKSYQTDKIPSNVTVPDDALVTSTGADGKTKLMRRKESSSYDASQTYTPREDRKEWDTIGLMGKLRVRVGQTVGDRWIKMREISDTVHEYLVR
jgi:hypothetical protein